MIHIALEGGLGNQLFIYAMARSIQLDTAEPIVIYDYHFANVEHTSLRLPQIVLPEVDITYEDKRTDSKLFYKELAPIRSFLFLASHKIYRTVFHVHDDNRHHRMETVLQPFWNRIGFGIASLGYLPVQRYRWPKDFFMSGYFFSRRFWGTHTEEIRKELCRPELISHKNYRILEQIQSSNAVCVHIRLGDYVTVEHFRKFLYVCNESYYQRAISQACSDLDDPVFFVFTNDLKSASAFPFPEKVKIVFMPDDNSALEDMQLMAQCKHFIISNSTFSWWGQFLSNHPGKKVYAPSQWYRMEKPVDFYEEEWVKIPIDLPEL